VSLGCASAQYFVNACETDCRTAELTSSVIPAEVDTMEEVVRRSSCCFLCWRSCGSYVVSQDVAAVPSYLPLEQFAVPTPYGCLHLCDNLAKITNPTNNTTCGHATSAPACLWVVMRQHSVMIHTVYVMMQSRHSGTGYVGAALTLNRAVDGAVHQRIWGSSWNCSKGLPEAAEGGGRRM
jgi:hypothetical protein